MNVSIDTLAYFSLIFQLFMTALFRLILSNTWLPIVPIKFVLKLGLNVIQLSAI